MQNKIREEQWGLILAILFLGGSYLLVLLSCSKRAALEEGGQESLSAAKRAAATSQSKEETKRLEPSFRFSLESFTSFVEQYLPEGLHGKVLSQPVLFLQLVKQLMEQEQVDPMLSRLVDKQHPLSEDYVPSDLVALEEYPELNLGRSGLKLRRVLIPELLAMNRAALEQNRNLWIGSTYRSFGYQKSVFERYAKRDGMAAANRYSARAGQSQHQLGLVVDFVPISQAFARTEAGKWMKIHALSYGFSLSYPEGKEASTGYIYEAWHFRYVGPIIAQLLREYFEEAQQDFFLFWNEAGPVLYKVYLTEPR